MMMILAKSPQCYVHQNQGGSIIIMIFTHFMKIVPTRPWMMGKIIWRISRGTAKGLVNPEENEEEIELRIHLLFYFSQWVAIIIVSYFNLFLWRPWSTIINLTSLLYCCPLHTIHNLWESSLRDDKKQLLILLSQPQHLDVVTILPTDDCKPWRTD